MNEKEVDTRSWGQRRVKTLKKIGYPIINIPSEKLNKIIK